MANRTPDYINNQVFITIDSSSQYDEQTEPTNGNFNTPENFKPPTAQNLSMFQSNGKYEPPRAQNLLKISVRTIDKENGLNNANQRGKILDRLRLSHNRQDSNSISPLICQESQDSLQHPALICRGVRIRRSCC